VCLPGIGGEFNANGIAVFPVNFPIAALGANANRRIFSAPPIEIA
jgi:hypothetical protein